MKRRAVTAAELLAQLETDPEYQERLRKRKAELAPIFERRRKDEAPLVQELREAGFQVESVYDFVNTKASYPEALPVLVRHLDVPHEAVIREGIIRSLAIKYGGVAVEEGLLKHFYSEKDPLLRWVLANALRVAMPLTRRKRHPEIQAVYDWGKSPTKGIELYHREGWHSSLPFSTFAVRRTSRHCERSQSVLFRSL